MIKHLSSKKCFKHLSIFIIQQTKYFILFCILLEPLVGSCNYNCLECVRRCHYSPRVYQNYKNIPHICLSLVGLVLIRVFRQSVWSVKLLTKDTLKANFLISTHSLTTMSLPASHILGTKMTVHAINFCTIKPTKQWTIMISRQLK